MIYGVRCPRESCSFFVGLLAALFVQQHTYNACIMMRLAPIHLTFPSSPSNIRTTTCDLYLVLVHLCQYHSAWWTSLLVLYDHFALYTCFGMFKVLHMLMLSAANLITLHKQIPECPGCIDNPACQKSPSAKLQTLVCVPRSAHQLAPRCLLAVSVLIVL